MTSKQLRYLLLFMCNKWSAEESNLIFNNSSDPTKWEYSLGEHIWNKWLNYCNMCGSSVNGITVFLLDLDDKCIQKLIDRSLEYYIIKKQ